MAVVLHKEYFFHLLSLVILKILKFLNKKIHHIPLSIYAVVTRREAHLEILLCFFGCLFIFDGGEGGCDGTAFW